MFKDLKEYQEITRIYHESVNISEEQRAINKAIAEAGFTDEEILYLDENFDELWDSELESLTEEIIAEQEQLDEMAGVALKAAAKGGAKLAPKVAKGAKGLGGMIKKGISAVSKKIPKGVKKAVGGAVKKIGGVVKKVAPFGMAAAGLGGAAAGGKLIGDAIRAKKKADKAKADAELQKKIDKGIKDSGMGNKGTAITQKGREQAAYNKGERAARKKLGDPTLNLTKSEIEAKKKTDPPKATETETKPKKKMHPIEKKNRARFGDAKVDKLKAKNVDFKAMRKGTMSKDDFIKKYPNSITAQKAKGLRDHAEWDAYDMVLEYLFSTEQVTSLEEANYVMMEMDHQTIGEIVKEVKVALNEDV